METFQKSLIIANWKCNPLSQEEVSRLFNAIVGGLGRLQKAEIVFCPPFVWLSFLISSSQAGIGWGAQDCFWQDKGAYTGEVSALMLKNLGCQYVLVGHSERRKYFQETDEIINKKLKAVLRARLKPILCVGEEARDAFDSEGKPLNEMSLAVADQLKKALLGISASRVKEIAIAYEPVWAISTNGTGVACAPDDAMKAGLFIRKTLTNLYNRAVAEKVKILYGGSVSSQNVADYVKGVRMDGLLVGGASLNASEFVKIVKNIAQ